MRVVTFVTLGLTVLCLAVAAYDLLAPTTLTYCTGADCSTVSCGSPAFPKAPIDFDDVDDAASCAGQPSASVALYAMIVAVVGVIGTAIASWRQPTDAATGSSPAG